MIKTVVIGTGMTTGQSFLEGLVVYGKLPLVECYPGLLNQAFMNILVNAIDAVEKRIAQNSTDF